MVPRPVQPDGGAVGAKLFYPNGAIQHAGIVTGLGDDRIAGHPYVEAPRDTAGSFGDLLLAREVSAVTAACMVMRRSVFAEAGGFDAANLPVAYNDVDLCLRLRRLGRRNLYTPRAVVRHDEGATRGDHYDRLDRALLLDAWGETIARGDPYYSPWLSLEGADYRPVAA